MKVLLQNIHFCNDGLPTRLIKKKLIMTYICNNRSTAKYYAIHAYSFAAIYS